MNRRDLTTTKRNHLHIRKKKPKKIDKKKELDFVYTDSFEAKQIYWNWDLTGFACFSFSKRFCFYEFEQTKNIKNEFNPIKFQMNRWVTFLL